MADMYTVTLTYAELKTLRSLCPRNSRTEEALDMAVFAAPVPASIAIWRKACAIANNFSTEHLKEPAEKLERWLRQVDNFKAAWDKDSYLYNLMLSGDAYPFSKSFDEVDFARWYQIAYDRARVLVFIRQLNESERCEIEEKLRSIPDETDLRQAISYACDRLAERPISDIPRIWNEITFKTTGDNEEWV